MKITIKNPIKKLIINKQTIFKLFKWTLKVGIIMVLLTIIMIAGINFFIKASVSKNILSVEDVSKKEADCIIVLGAGVRADGTPTWMLEDRVLVGIELYESEAASKLLMSGDHGRVEYDEVNVMKNYAIDAGVKSSDIFMDHAGFSTYETMYRAKEVFGAEKVIIVTQEYHLYRAVYIAQKLGLEAYGVTADKRDYSSSQKYRVAREWIARVKDFFKVIIRPEPTYLGDKIDISCDGDVTNDKSQ